MTAPAYALDMPRPTDVAHREHENWCEIGPFLTDKQGISGVCCVHESPERAQFLVAHDNKRTLEPRLGIITTATGARPQYRELCWPAGIPEPIDLESLSCVPGADPGTVIAATSRGLCFEIKIDLVAHSMKVTRQFILPELSTDSNVESCCLYGLGKNGTLIAWAERGDGPDSPARLVVGKLGKFGHPEPQLTHVLTGPLTESSMRHLSDLAFSRDGSLYGTTTVDHGNDGPFWSMLVHLGSVTNTGEGANFNLRMRPEPIYTRMGLKFEGLTFGSHSDAPVIGTDDENFGGVLIMRERSFATPPPMLKVAEFPRRANW